MQRTGFTIQATLLACLSCAKCVSSDFTSKTFRNQNDKAYEDFLQKADEILDRMPVIDGHNDFPNNVRDLTLNDLRRVNFSSDLTQVEPWASYVWSHTDIPRLRRGKTGGVFWIAAAFCESTNKDAIPQTIESIDVIKRLVQEYSDDLQYASSAAEIESAIKNKKIASLIGIESGHVIQSSAGVLRMLYELGARYLTLNHWCNTPWSDASTVDDPIDPISPTSNGLSEFGLEMIDEMNRIGMMVDLSHVSVATMKAALDRSQAPIIFSHSSSKAICDNHRNVPDDVLELVKENGGIVMVNFFPGYVQCDTSKNATIWDVVAHFQHLKNIMGPDHIGIGSDFDGVNAVVEGLEDVSKYPNIIAALLSTGNWTEEDLEKIAGRNLLRVFKQVEIVRDSLRDAAPMQTLITREATHKANLSTECVTAVFIDDPNAPRNLLNSEL